MFFNTVCLVSRHRSVILAFLHFHFLHMYRTQQHRRKKRGNICAYKLPCIQSGTDDTRCTSPLIPHYFSFFLFHLFVYSSFSFSFVCWSFIVSHLRSSPFLSPYFYLPHPLLPTFPVWKILSSHYSQLCFRFFFLIKWATKEDRGRRYLLEENPPERVRKD